MNQLFHHITLFQGETLVGLNEGWLKIGPLSNTERL